MRKFTLGICSLFVAALLHAQSPSSQLSAGIATGVDISKVLEFKEAVHNFGKIALGKPVEFDVIIKNISNDSIRIENVRVGCGCTTPKYDAVTHAPGETFKVTLGFSNMQEGIFEKYADIFFSNGMMKQVKFFGTGYKAAENAATVNNTINNNKLKN